MWWAVCQLCRPCNYLRIRHGDTLWHSKRVYDWVFPLMLTVITVGGCWFSGISLRIQGHPVVSSSMLNLLALLIAFYMAALAAVATFARDGMDTKMEDDPAEISIYSNESGKDEDVELTYRQFISYLFGYCAFSAIVIYLFVVFFSHVWPRILKNLLVRFTDWVFAFNIFDFVAFCLLVFLFWQLLMASLLGIWFLSERVQTIGKNED